MKILFTYKVKRAGDDPPPWMKTDLSILTGIGHVTQYPFTEVKKFPHLWRFIAQFIHLIRFRYDVYFCYFSDYHSLLPVLFARARRKKSVVIVAGYDADYIFTTQIWRRMAARIVYRFSGEVLCISQGLIEDLKRNGVDTRNFRKVPFGWDPSKIVPRKKVINAVLTVATYDDERNYMRKGIDRILKVAALLPDIGFLIIGGGERQASWGNVFYSEKMPFTDVIKAMGRAQVYIQPSRYEGLCSATAEAMLAGCNVITSDCHVRELCESNVIPGEIWDNHPEIVAERIKKLMKIRSFSNANRQKIIEDFPLSKRKETIKQILKP
jgi:glycosyltransferase involved in cell wall biosynthesis